jgi:hypothetical protein
MRSEQVFRAAEEIGNRYELCRLAAKTTRRLHFASLSTQDAIQDAFVQVRHAIASTRPIDRAQCGEQGEGVLERYNSVDTILRRPTN